MIAILLAALLFAAGTPREPLTCKVTPEAVQVGLFYNGANLRVEGVAAAGSKVIVTVVGSDREERFNRKARFGPVWISSGRVKISGVPSLFLRFSTEPVAAMLSCEAIARRRLDEASLMARMHIEPRSRDDRGDAAIRGDYLALKRSEGGYSFGNSGVVMDQAGECRRFALEFRWPKRAPPAKYEVRVYEVAGGEVVREVAVPLPVVRTGFPAWMAGLAENRASLYGLTAILFGALAGFGIDFLTTRIFGKKRAAGH